jgi:hypothetical protein
MLHDDCTNVQNLQGARRIYFKIFVIVSTVIKLGLFNKTVFLKIVYFLSTNLKFAGVLISFLIGGMSAVEEKFSIRRIIVVIYHVTMVAFYSVNV